MSVFGAYARYYDLLYRDKDYRTEADHVDALIQRHAPGARGVLELGCGTGAHALPLARKGYELHGIDLSDEMLAAARRRFADHAGLNVSFSSGDARTFRAARTFDVVIALFHVVSYQQTNADLSAAFATARAHLQPGGLFLFDCWYGPAVLTDRPVTRVRRIEDELTHVTRIAEPLLHATQNLVDVNYHVFLRDKASGATSELHETHRMRYLFSPELELLLEQSGLRIAYSGEWLSEQGLSYATWSACFAAKAT